MVYEVTLVYGQNCNVERHTVVDVARIINGDGVHSFVNGAGIKIAIFTNDVILSIKLISLG